MSKLFKKFMKGKIVMKKMVSLCSIALLLFAFTASASAASWEWILSTNKYSVFVDTDTIKKSNATRNSPEIYRIWIKRTFNQDGVNQMIEQLRSNGESTAGYEKLSYSLEFGEYKRTSESDWRRSIEWIDYDTNGKVLNSGQYNSAWKRIKPSTVSEAIFKKVRALKK